MIEYYSDLCARFPIVSIEDGCAENDWDGWKKLTARLGNKIQLVGDTWKSALRVRKMDAKNEVVFEKIDPDFPKELLEQGNF